MCWEGVHPERVQKFHDTPHLYLILCLFHQGFPTFILYNEQVLVKKALNLVSSSCELLNLDRVLGASKLITGQVKIVGDSWDLHPASEMSTLL